MKRFIEKGKLAGVSDVSGELVGQRSVRVTRRAMTGYKVKLQVCVHGGVRWLCWRASDCSRLTAKESYTGEPITAEGDRHKTRIGIRRSRYTTRGACCSAAKFNLDDEGDDEEPPRR